jgi:hypothetical protein
MLANSFISVKIIGAQSPLRVTLRGGNNWCSESSASDSEGREYAFNFYNILKSVKQL